MIRLDAATVLLQWAAGGMLFCWFTTRRREVGLGYGWLLRGVFGGLAVAAAIVGMRYGAVPVREAASIGVAATCAFALAVSVVRRRAGVSGQRGLLLAGGGDPPLQPLGRQLGVGRIEAPGARPDEDLRKAYLGR